MPIWTTQPRACRARVIARPGFHSIVTTMLLVALSILIVKDIITQRSGLPAPPALT
ncbi:hypothetical protein [Bradyrhizobium sp.]|uniref:hypothetical protein n=1 Tax=Bradyrhizobium sp. TaxID=376 RepID=UPI002608CEC1|nr:hypothetical protein [Bradyrhizobium sp.]